MPKGPQGQKRPADVIGNAVHVMKVLTGETEDISAKTAKSPAPCPPGSVARHRKGRYSPAECTGIKKVQISGKPDEKHISTSFVEAHNKTMRMHMRRFTRLTNGHSKKVANHVHMVALYTLFYNFIRTHGTLRMTPAMAAGIAPTFLGFEDVLTRIDAGAIPAKRGPYKKRAAA